MRPDAETAALADVNSVLREFECVDGDRTSFHTTNDGEKHRYVTLGFRGSSPHEVGSALCDSLRKLRGSLRGNAILFRRIGPQIERDSETGDCSIRMRLAIPGADWSRVTTCPEGLPYPKV
jgi:hypothetical protein